MKRTRRTVQLTLLALVIAGAFTVGASCERWCPFGGVEASYTYLTEGNMLCSLSVSNFFILGGVLLTVVVLRRAFCGYMCPIGTITELVYGLGRRLRIPAIRVAPKYDRLLAPLKYVVLAAILYVTWQSAELIFRSFDPCYALISRHGADITFWAYVVSAAIVLLSLAITVPFCRWFCPFAAVLNPFSRFAFTRVQRDTEVCNDCGVCAKSCPMAISVDQFTQVTHARCTSCLSCVDACPRSRKSDRALSWGPPRQLGQRWSQAAIIAILITCTASAVAASYLFPLPSFIKTHGDPPPQIAEVQLKVENLTCRGRANLFYYFLERDDLFEIPGYFKVEAWPDPNIADVRITFDPKKTDADAIKQAITEPYYDAEASVWRSSPFCIEGYNPLVIPGDPTSDLLPP